MLPFPGKPVCGGGIRVWGIGKGLELSGHEVVYSLPEELVCDDMSLPAEIRSNAHEPEKLNDLILEVMPDLIIIEQWGLATYLNDLKIPLAIDLHGPLSLENAYKQKSNFLSDALTKIEALSKADLLICPGQYQKQYFYTWFMMAGVDPLDPGIAVVPVGMDPKLPEKKNAPHPHLVYGGVTWPWIDPFPGIEIAAKMVSENPDAEFDLYIQNPPLMHDHPLYSINKNITKNYGDKLKGFDRVKCHDFIPHDQLRAKYSQATAAVDLYKHNPERQLACTTRTVEYMWTGLPVIYSHYAELAKVIEKYDAGWILDPEDESAIEKAMTEALTKPSVAKKKGKNAQRLVLEQFAWDKTVKGLLPYIENPVIRTKKGTMISGFRDYFRAESTDEILEAKNQVAKLNDTIREVMYEAEQQKREKDKRIEKLGEQIRDIILEKDKKLMELMADHKKDLGKKDEENSRLLNKIDHENQKRDDQIQRLQNEAVKQQDEIRRLNLEKDDSAKSASEELKRVSDSLSEEMSLIKKSKAVEAEKHLTEIKKLHEQITSESKLHNEQFRKLTDEKQDIREQTSAELKKVIEEKDGLFTQTKERSEKDNKRLQDRIDKLSGELEEARKELAEEIKRMNLDRQELMTRQKDEVDRIVLKNEQDFSRSQNGFQDELTELRRQLTRESEKHQDDGVAYQKAIKQLNLQREQEQSKAAEKMERVQLNYEEQLKELRSDLKRISISREKDHEKAEDQLKKLNDNYEQQLKESVKQTEAEIQKRDKELEKQAEQMVQIEHQWQGKLDAKDNDIETVRQQLDDLNNEITKRLTELDRVASEKEIYIREAEKRFGMLEEKVTDQHRSINGLTDELAASKSSLENASRSVKQLQFDLDSSREDFNNIQTHAQNLEGEVPVLRRRAELAERELEDLRDSPGLKGRSRRSKRSAKYFTQIPKLGALWGVNLATNAYMDLWQRKTGKNLFPGRKKNKGNGGEES